MEKVAFYSYKGGVGRSLLLVNTARFLALTGRRVVALDLDFEAPGLHYKLGVERKVETGALQLLQRSLDGDLPTLDEVRQATIEVPMPATHGGWLRLLAAGPAPTPEYWADLGRLHELLVVNQDAGLLEAVLDLQVRIEEALNPEVLLVDARTGVTGLGGIATMALCDRVVLMTTRTRESIDGIRVIAESLRATPTLRGGERQLELVASRVQGTEAIKRQELLEALGDHFELPHDQYDGAAERLLGDGSPPKTTTRLEKRRTIDSLLARTLEWISKTFPTEATLANRAIKRLVEVGEIWRELTDASRRPGALANDGWHWLPDMLATNINFSGPDGSTRTADVVAKLKNGELAMVIEHLDDEPDPSVAHWWAEHVPARIIVLQWWDKWQRRNKRHMYFCRNVAQERFVADTDRGDLPSPVEFELLPNPVARSVETMLQVAPRTRFYDERLIAEWVRSAGVSLHGGVRPRPSQAKQILDGLAALEDVGRAKEIAAKCVSIAFSQDNGIQLHVNRLERLVLDGLCAPLCWRMPPRAFVDLARTHWPGPPPPFYALRRLAGFMGLDYDPEAVYQRDAPRLIVDDADFSLVVASFSNRELSFEWLLHSHLPWRNFQWWDPPAPSYSGILGAYHPRRGCILLAEATINTIAKSIGHAARHIGSLTLLHLAVLGLLHNGIDLDGQRWEASSTGDLSLWTVVPPPAVVALAQFFMHRFLVELDDEHLLKAFETLTDSQPPEYGAWRAMAHVSLEAGRSWMMSTRRGTGDPPPVDLDAFLRPR